MDKDKRNYNKENAAKALHKKFKINNPLESRTISSFNKSFYNEGMKVYYSPKNTNNFVLEIYATV